MVVPILAEPPPQAASRKASDAEEMTRAAEVRRMVLLKRRKRFMFAESFLPGSLAVGRYIEVNGERGPLRLQSHSAEY